ncbi:Transcriptional regulator, TetR family protein [Minicystis rosea]|nr:Transcriptional regulator, TetR family protein [Minicystis rosea]
MKKRAAPAVRDTYHHGSLREALLDAAVAMVSEESPEAVSVREVARRAGVSSGAPFRHFADKNALMTAVAEEGAKRLRAEIEAATADAAAHPLQKFRAIGVAFVTFAVRHPGHFRVMNMPEYASPSRSSYLADMQAAGTAEIRALLAEAEADGRVLPWDPAMIMLASRALVYGLARMFIDGHCAELGIGMERVEEIAAVVTDIFGGGFVRGTEAERGPEKAQRAPAPRRAAKKRAKG